MNVDHLKLDPDNNHVDQTGVSLKKKQYYYCKSGIEFTLLDMHFFPVSTLQQKLISKITGSSQWLYTSWSLIYLSCSWLLKHERGTTPERIKWGCSLRFILYCMEYFPGSWQPCERPLEIWEAWHQAPKGSHQGEGQDGTHQCGVWNEMEKWENSAQVVTVAVIPRADRIGWFCG